MKKILNLAFAALLSCVLAAQTHAAPFHYNVDWQTALGPVQLVTMAPPSYNSGLAQWTFFFGAKNNGIPTQTDVLMLLQFVYDPTIALTFNDGAENWTGNSHTMSFPGLPQYSMLDTDAPLFWTKLSPTRIGTLLATDTVPYVQIGDILGGQTVPFNLLVQIDPAFTSFSVVGSFVALPEPSTLVLLGIGAFGIIVARRRFRKS